MVMGGHSGGELRSHEGIGMAGAAWLSWFIVYIPLT